MSQNYLKKINGWKKKEDEIYEIGWISVGEIIKWFCERVFADETVICGVVSVKLNYAGCPCFYFTLPF